jgi:hypothetical protein
MFNCSDTLNPDSLAASCAASRTDAPADGVTPVSLTATYSGVEDNSNMMYSWANVPGGAGGSSVVSFMHDLVETFSDIEVTISDGTETDTASCPAIEFYSASEIKAFLEPGLVAPGQDCVLKWQYALGGTCYLITVESGDENQITPEQKVAGQVTGLVPQQSYYVECRDESEQPISTSNEVSCVVNPSFIEN